MTAQKRVSKRVFLAARDCPTRGWFVRNLPPVDLSPAEQFRIEEGQEIGRRARQLFPGGVLVEEPSLESAADRTRQLLDEPSVPAIFEATFCPGDYVAKADILERDSDAWHLIEVKSGTSPKREYVEDLAYTALVLRQAGLSLSRMSLMVVASDYEPGKPNDTLFAVHDCTVRVQAVLEEYESTWPVMPGQVLTTEAPVAAWIYACRNCPYFATDCLGKDVTHPIFKLPKINKGLFDRLAAQGIRSIADIPRGFLSDAKQQTVHQAVVSQSVVVQKEPLRDLLSQVEWPAYYLDFETVTCVLPLYPGVAPYEQVPTQYSLHVYESPAAERRHAEYLADPQVDGRRELADRLLDDLGSSGSIIVYSSFENTILKGLADAFPDLKDRIQACQRRIFDLMQVFKSAVYHPNFFGSASIKYVLPALVELSYDDLAISSGDEAAVAFVRMARGEMSADEMQRVREALLDYCRRDTLAMVRLHERVMELADS